MRATDDIFLQEKENFQMQETHASLLGKFFSLVALNSKVPYKICKNSKGKTVGNKEFWAELIHAHLLPRTHTWLGFAFTIPQKMPTKILENIKPKHHF